MAIVTTSKGTPFTKSTVTKDVYTGRQAPGTTRKTTTTNVYGGTGMIPTVRQVGPPVVSTQPPSVSPPVPVAQSVAPANNIQQPMRAPTSTSNPFAVQRAALNAQNAAQSNPQLAARLQSQIPTVSRQSAVPQILTQAQIAGQNPTMPMGPVSTATPRAPASPLQDMPRVALPVETIGATLPPIRIAGSPIPQSVPISPQYQQTPTMAPIGTGTIAGFGGQAATPARPSSFKKGGTVKKTGMALVHAGEEVLTANQMKVPAIKTAIAKVKAAPLVPKAVIKKPAPKQVAPMKKAMSLDKMPIAAFMKMRNGPKFGKKR